MRISDWSSDVCSSDLLLAPFVPHIASELWEALGHEERLDQVAWPSYSNEALEEEQLLIVVQVNGRSEERRVGKECAIRVRSRGRRFHEKKKKCQDMKVTLADRTIQTTSSQITQ